MSCRAVTCRAVPCVRACLLPILLARHQCDRSIDRSVEPDDPAPIQAGPKASRSTKRSGARDERREAERAPPHLAFAIPRHVTCAREPTLGADILGRAITPAVGEARRREAGSDRRRGEIRKRGGTTAVLCGKMMETQNYWEDTAARSMQVKYER